MFSVSFACPLSRSARVSSPMAAADGTAVDPTAPQNTAPFPEAPFPDVMAVAQDLADQAYGACVAPKLTVADDQTRMSFMIVAVPIMAATLQAFRAEQKALVERSLPAMITTAVAEALAAMEVEIAPEEGITMKGPMPKLIEKVFKQMAAGGSHGSEKPKTQADKTFDKLKTMFKKLATEGTLVLNAPDNGFAPLAREALKIFGNAVQRGATNDLPSFEVSKVASVKELLDKVIEHVRTQGESMHKPLSHSFTKMWDKLKGCEDQEVEQVELMGPAALNTMEGKELIRATMILVAFARFVAQSQRPLSYFMHAAASGDATLYKMAQAPEDASVSAETASKLNCTHYSLQMKSLSGVSFHEIGKKEDFKPNPKITHPKVPPTPVIPALGASGLGANLKPSVGVVLQVKPEPGKTPAQSGLEYRAASKYFAHRIPDGWTKATKDTPFCKICGCAQSAHWTNDCTDWQDKIKVGEALYKPHDEKLVEQWKEGISKAIPVPDRDGLPSYIPKDMSCPVQPRP